MTPINFERVKTLNKILQGKEKPISKSRPKIMGTDPGLERNIWIFGYLGKYHKIEAGKHESLKEPAVRDLVQDVPETKLYYVCTEDLMCPLPSAFVGQSAQAILCKDDSDVITRIKTMTGVSIPKNYL